MTEATLTPMTPEGEDTWTLAATDLPAVSSADGVHDILEAMLRHRIPRVLVTGPQGEVLGVLHQRELLPFDDEFVPRQMGEVVTTVAAEWNDGGYAVVRQAWFLPPEEAAAG
jgi:CBS domain containing-hemolysin-like protein